MWGVLVGLCCALLFGIWLVRKPRIQRLIIYLRYAKPPLRWFPLQYSKEGYHRAITLRTCDGEILGSWIYYRGCQPDCDTVVLYLHGNAGTRGQSRRYRLYGILVKLFNGPVFSVDYRGFGDSSGSPTETGVLIDAITAWNYVVEEMGASNVYIWGHSLGTGISCRLAEAISLSDSTSENDDLYAFSRFLAPNSKSKLKGVFLEAPFESLRTAAETHYSLCVLWILPKSFRDFILDRIVCLCDQLASIERIQLIHVPIMILHARNDWVISAQQGINLAARLSPSLVSHEINNYKSELYIGHGLTLHNQACQLSLFPTGGHNNLATQPQFESVVSRFISTAIIK